MNNVILMGRLTKDPELSYTANGKPFLRFSIAVNRIGEGADFINCTAWEKTAQTITEYFKKGQRILVQGSIRTGSYNNKNGQTVYTTDVLVNNFEFIENKNSFSEDYDNNFQNSNNKKSKKSFNSNQYQAPEIDDNTDEEFIDDNDETNEESEFIDDNSASIDDDDEDDEFPF